LSMQSCSFTGPIPASLSNLTNLTFLALNGNQLTGSIPPGMGQLSKLVWFDLSVNNLSGPLPISNATQPGLDQMKSAQHFAAPASMMGISRRIYPQHYLLIHIKETGQSKCG
jgi:hypothetical protein